MEDQEQLEGCTPVRFLNVYNEHDESTRVGTRAAAAAGNHFERELGNFFETNYTLFQRPTCARVPCRFASKTTIPLGACLPAGSQ